MDTMNTKENTLTRSTVAASRIDANGAVRAGFSRTLMRLDRLLLSGATPRAHRREGYPEIELHLMLSGHRDRF
jgi:hypothetical protein